MLLFSLGLEAAKYPAISGLNLRTKKQQKALGFVLGNIWKHGTKPIYLSLRKRQRAFGAANELSAWRTDRGWSTTGTPLPAG